jgi:hypothetical protein
MSLNDQQGHETGNASATEDGDNSLTREVAIICTAWITTALLAGVGFVALRDVFLTFV